MKTLITFTILLPMLTSLSINASTLKQSNFVATDGTTIKITYTVSELHPEDDYLLSGDNYVVSVDWAEVSVGFAKTPKYGHYDKLIKITNICTTGDNISYVTFNCRIGESSKAEPFTATFYPSTGFWCSTEISDDLFADYFPTLPLYIERDQGKETTCTQQAAVKLGNDWLIDPISKTHDFKFNMNY